MITIKHDNDLTILKLQDPLSMERLIKIEDKLIKILNEGVKYLIIDLEDVSVFHSPGIRLLISSRRHLLRVGGTLLLVGLQPQPEKVLRVVEVLDLFERTDSMQEAMERIESQKKLEMSAS